MFCIQKIMNDLKWDSRALSWASKPSSFIKNIQRFCHSKSEDKWGEQKEKLSILWGSRNGQGEPGQLHPGLSGSGSDSLWQKGETQHTQPECPEWKRARVFATDFPTKATAFLTAMQQTWRVSQQLSARGKAQHSNVSKVVTAAPKLHEALIKPPPEEQEGLYQGP